MTRLNPQVTIIGVTNPGDGSDDDRNDFILGMSSQIPHVLVEAGEVWADFGIVSQPSMVFVAADGSWERDVGRQDPNDLLARSRELVDTSS